MRATWPFLAHWAKVFPRMSGEVGNRQQSISGAETVTPAMGARWEISGELVIHGEARELQWQAFVAQMEGGLGTTLVPLWTRHRPYDRDGHKVDWDAAAGLAGAQTWDHFGFDAAAVATMTLAANAPLRATTIKATLGNTTGLRPGQFFSIGERLHQVQHHWQDADGTANLMIRPPLRAAAPAGRKLILDRPVCVMRLAGDTADIEYTPDGVGRVTCTFVEAEVARQGAGTDYAAIYRAARR